MYPASFSISLERVQKPEERGEVLFKRIFWINLGLLIIVLLLGINVYQLWRSILSQNWKGLTLVSAGNISEGSEPVSEPESPVIPGVYAYDVIADKDLFRPERTEWSPPPPESVDSEKKEPFPQAIPEMNQPLMKDPLLYGIMITGVKKSALMKGYVREDAKPKTRKVRLGNGEVREVPLPPQPGKVIEDKVKRYKIGDTVNESTIVDILPDKVILNRKGEEYEIFLRDNTRQAEKNQPMPGEEMSGQRFMDNAQGIGQEEFSGQESVPDQSPGFQRPPAYVPPPGFPGFQPPPGGVPMQPGYGYPPGFPGPGAVNIPNPAEGGQFPQLPGQGPGGFVQRPGYPGVLPPGVNPPANPFYRPPYQGWNQR